MSIKEFLTLDNLQLLIYCVLALILLILGIISVCRKPNKVIDTVSEQITALLPTFIRIAEDKFGAGKGREKNAYVLALVQEWFTSEKLEFTDYYLKLVKGLIEQILNTPQKK